MLWTLEIVLLIAIFVMNIGGYILDFVFTPKIPEMDELSKDIFTRMQKSDAGTAGSTAKQKKALQQILGQDLMAQYPIIEMLRPRLPGVADYIEKYPGAVPILGEILNHQVSDKFLSKLPPELQTLAQSLMGLEPSTEQG